MILFDTLLITILFLRNLSFCYLERMTLVSTSKENAFVVSCWFFWVLEAISKEDKISLWTDWLNHSYILWIFVGKVLLAFFLFLPLNNILIIIWRISNNICFFSIKITSSQKKKLRVNGGSINCEKTDNDKQYLINCTYFTIRWTKMMKKSISMKSTWEIICIV